MDIQDKQLSDKQIARLADFFLERTTYSLPELMGYFTAIASSPRSIPFTEWLERLDIQKLFTSQKEAGEIVACISTLYNNTYLELREKRYKPIALATIQESSLPVDEKTELFMAWIEGYFMGVELIGQEWLNTGHTEAMLLLQAIVRVAKALCDDQTRMATKEDFELVRTHAKAVYDYWVAHAVCKGKPFCILTSPNTGA